MYVQQQQQHYHLAPTTPPPKNTNNNNLVGVPGTLLLRLIFSRSRHSLWDCAPRANNALRRNNRGKVVVIIMVK
jgi:hypothetical protein